MRWMTHYTVARLLGAVALAVLPGLMVERGLAASASLQSVGASQTVTPQAGAAATAPAQVANPASTMGQGVVLDRVVAVVNDDVILESDVDEERRFEEIQPYRKSAAELSRERMLERLIDRELILQQAESEPEDVITDQDLDAQLLSLRKDIPDCKQYPLRDG